MTTDKPHASLDEVLEFCNEVRKVGGGTVLDALMPGTPRSAKTCLIAKNLNFSCSVSPADTYQEINSDEILRYEDEEDDREYKWYMFVGDEEIRQRISEGLGLPIVVTKECVFGNETVDLVSTRDKPGILLPREIGRVADTYDTWWDQVTTCTPYKDGKAIIDLRGEFGAFIDPELVRPYESAPTAFEVLR